MNQNDFNNSNGMNNNNSNNSFNNNVNNFGNQSQNNFLNVAVNKEQSNLNNSYDYANVNRQNNMNGFNQSFNNPNNMNNVGQGSFVSQNSMNNNQNNFNNISSVGNNPNQFNNYGNSGPTKPARNGGIFQNKLVWILIAVVVLVAITLVLYLTVFKKNGNGSSGYHEKTHEELSKNYTMKEYKVGDDILIEITNKNSVPVTVDYKVEFYNDAGSVIDVDDGIILCIGSNKTSYDHIYYINRNVKYASYKIIPKFSEAYLTDYSDKVEIVSNNRQDKNYIVQLKNNSDKPINISALLLFKDANGNYVGVEDIYLRSVSPGETSSESVMIPYDRSSGSYDIINFSSVEIKFVTVYDAT